MASNAEDLTVNYEEDGVLVVKELDKAILSKGAWVTIVIDINNGNVTKMITDPIDSRFADIEK